MKKKILIIGASTGGPTQIQEILSSMDSLESTIIISQHMCEEMLPSFISGLQRNVKVPVFCTPLESSFSEGSVIVCCESSIVKKNDGVYTIVADKSQQVYTPDINTLLLSFINIANDFEISVLIMTGIGRDGVDGAKELKLLGAKIYAQDEDTSPVYGMPKALYESGIVDSVKSLSQIKDYVRSL